MAIHIIYIFKMIHIQHQKTGRSIHPFLPQVFVHQKLSGIMVIQSCHGISSCLIFQKFFPFPYLRDISDATDHRLVTFLLLQCIQKYSLVVTLFQKLQFHRSQSLSEKELTHLLHIFRMDRTYLTQLTEKWHNSFFFFQLLIIQNHSIAIREILKDRDSRIFHQYF